jgi:hypothetical protein
MVFLACVLVFFIAVQTIGLEGVIIICVIAGCIHMI